MSLADLSERTALTESVFDDDELQAATDSEIDSIKEVTDDSDEESEQLANSSSNSESEADDNN